MKKRDTAKDGVKENMERLCHDVAKASENRDPQQLKAILDVYASAARRWSHNNLCAIISQKRDIGRPVTIREARAMGHFPIKGAKPASIFVPVFVEMNLRIDPTIKQLIDDYRQWAVGVTATGYDPNQPETVLLFVESHEKLKKQPPETQREAAGRIISIHSKLEKVEASAGKALRFKLVPCVYDLGKETDGPPLSVAKTETPERMGELLGAIKAYAQESGWPVSAVRLSLGELGSASPGGIQVGEWIDEPSRVKTLFHEIAHQILHVGQSSDQSRDIQELQAEAVAYAVSKHFGVHPEFSGKYIQSYNGSPRAIMFNLKVICDTSKKIIQGISAKLQWEQERTTAESEEIEMRYHLYDDTGEHVFEDYPALMKGIFESKTELEMQRLVIFRSGLGGSFYQDQQMSGREFVDEVLREFCDHVRAANLDGYVYVNDGELTLAPDLNDVPEKLRAGAVEVSAAASGQAVGI